MKAKFIVLQDKHIIITDDKLKHGDIILVNSGNGVYENEIHKFSEEPCPPPDVTNRNISKKIIAGIPPLPPIDYNGFESELNIVDIEKLANKSIDSLYGAPKADIGSSARSYWETQILGFIEGFKACQQLDGNTFGEEDMRKYGLQQQLKVLHTLKETDQIKVKIDDLLIELAGLYKSKYINIEVEVSKEAVKIIKIL